MKATRKKIEKQATPGYGIYPKAAPGQQMGSYLSQGKWVNTNPEKDKQIKDYTTFVKKNPFKAEPVITVDPETYISYAQKKEDEMDRENFLGMASLLIDPNNPETQKNAYSVVPELRDVPEQFYNDQVALSMTIHALLRDGQVRGREDFELLYYILGPDFMFPMFPLWDPNGALIKELALSTEYQKWIKKYTKNIWNPVTRRYQTDVDSNFKGDPELNNRIKLIIAKRLLPALRHLNSMDDVAEALKQSMQGNTKSAEFWSGKNSVPTQRNYNSFTRK